jgi:hypothetical protein
VIVGLEKFFRIENFFTKNDLYRGNFMWEIDCAHSRSMKTLPTMAHSAINVLCYKCNEEGNYRLYI